MLRGFALAAVLAAASSAPGAERPDAVPHPLARYNYAWDRPGEGPTDSMPIGNGDLAANVYAGPGGLYLLLSKSDAFDWEGNLIKTGRVRITARPDPFAAEGPFRQELDIVRARVTVRQGGVTFTVWADATRPVYHVEVESPRPIEVTVEPEFWKRRDGDQDTRHDRGDALIWAHHNTRSSFRGHLEHYGIAQLAATHPDPFLNVTVGNLVESPRLHLRDGRLVGTGRTFDIRIHTHRAVVEDVSKFVAALEALAAANRRRSSREAHEAWWRAFWQRSWIIASDNTLPPEQRERPAPPAQPGLRGEPDGAFVVAQHYNIHRYMMACQSRGGCQVQFNGGLFTTPIAYAGRAWDEDGRNWGRRFTFQNQRLLYWPMIHAGDYDLTDCFFEYYLSVLPLKKAFTKLWFGHEGSYFRENIQLSGDEIADAALGGKPPRSAKEANYRRGWHNFHFNSTLEIPYMALRRYQHTRDAAFRDRVLIPLAREGLKFFDKHYGRDANGRIRLEPSQALETFWVAVNPTQDIAGLKALLEGMLEIDGPTDADRADWQRMLRQLPDIPTAERDGRRILVPAESYSNRHNAETPELYAAFPYDVFSIARGNQQILIDTMPHRTTKNAFGCRCWTQDQVQFAYAGLAAEAMEGLDRRFRQYSRNMRFPMFARERPDHVPDFDHNGSGSVALQKMLLNEAGRTIYLLPAWPACWDADFRLHASDNTVVWGTVRDGTLVRWGIRPEARRKDVVVGRPQKIPAPPVVPANAHPLRAGSDQAGGSRFAGAIGRVSVFRGPLDAAAIAELARGKRTDRPAGESLVGCWLNPAAGQVLSPGDVPLPPGPLTVEAWIRPGAAESGRIADKITPGQRDGFLLDAWPKLSLRLIVGPTEVNFPGVLKAGAWQHVAAVIDRRAPRVYLDGRPAPTGR